MMYVKKEQIIKGVSKYVEDSMLSQVNVSQPLQKGLIKVLVVTYIMKASAYIDKFASIGINGTLGITNGADGIDVDAFTEAAKLCVKANPELFKISTPIGNWAFDESDVEKISTCIKNGG